MSEYLGKYHLVCDHCGSRITVRVYEDVHGHEYTTCPECTTNLRAIGIDT